MTSFYAVLAGDVINSRRLKTRQLEKVRTNLCEAATEIDGWQKHLVAGGPDFFRGDAWQLLLADPRWALRAALFLRASLRAEGTADTRIVAGLGSVARVDKRRVSLSTGEAFTIAGHRLDALGHHESMAIVITEHQPELAGWLAAVGALCGVVAGRWTERQAQAVRLALSPREPLQSEIGRQMKPPVSQQAVTKSLAGAAWHGLRPALRQFESTGWERLLLSPAVIQP